MTQNETVRCGMPQRHQAREVTEICGFHKPNGDEDANLEPPGIWIAPGSRANRNVWSAALSQAKNDGDRLVCANVYGLCWSTRLLAMMECAALSSYLARQSWKTSSGYRF